MPVNFTHENEPDVAGNAANLADIAARTIYYEDGLSTQNSPIGNLDGFGPVYSTDNAPRMGDSVDDLTGVLDFAFNQFRVRAVEDGANVFTETNPRTAEPDDVGGTLKVASFNVLNYFKSIDTIQEATNAPDNPGDNTVLGHDPRGADSVAEFERQTEKLVNVLMELDADVLGLVEIENDFLPGSSGNAIEYLVNALNAEIGSVTYSWVNPDQQFVGGDAIAVGFIYKTGVVQIADGTSVATLTDADFPGLGLDGLLAQSTVGGVFNGVNTSRVPLAVTFEEIATGGEFTAVVNHLKSKSGTGTGADADQLDGQGNWQQQRELAATALTEWLETDPTGSGDSDVVLLGDFNAYFREDTIDVITGAGFENLQDTLPDPYSYVFDGQRGALDYVFTNGSLTGQVTGVTEWHINADEADALDYNLDFGRDPNIFDEDALARVSDHDPLIIGLDLTEDPIVPTYKLQILHASDFEAGLSAIDDAPRFAAIVDRLEDLEVNSITLASGDNYIPSPFFNASSDPALDPFFEESIGRADIRILNTIGVEASVIGNHEFDAGPREVQNLIRPAGAGADGGGAYEGTQFGYLAANLDFSQEPDLAPNAGTTPITEANFGTGASGGRRLGGSMILEENGEQIGVVGVTTPVFEDITTPGRVRIIGPRTLDANDGDDSDFIALAAIVQNQIDALTAQGVNKIVIVSQLQELENEQHLISFLHDVDVVVAGGSNTLLSDGTDVLRTGDTSDGPYAQIITNAGGDQTVLVNTDGNYKYVGRLVLEFDSEGHIVPESLDPNINGAYATDQAGLERVYEGTGIDPFAEGSKGDTVRDITTVIDGVISVKDGVQFGSTDVYLEARRLTVRSEETNLGNLSADANLFYAKQADAGVMISIKNGGGIRDSIGTIAPDGTELPPAANPEAGKEAGEISQLDIENSLRFNNALSMVTLTPQQLLEALENGVSNPGGIFAHVGGLRFSYDSSLPAGNRVNTVALVDEDGRVIAVIVENGEVVADAPAAIRMVTLTFLIGTPNAAQPGGFNRPDGFKFAEYIAANPTFANRVDLDPDASGADDVASRTGAATFTDNGREQDAFAEYIAAKYSDTPYQEADTPQSGDTRIQNVTVRDDTVLDSPNVVGTNDDDDLNGTAGKETIYGRNGDDVIHAMGGNDRLIGGEGADTMLGGTGNDIYVVDNGGDEVTEAADEGIDRVISSITYLLGSNVERLALTGTSAIDGFGNELANVIVGNEAANVLNGGVGNDVLSGLGGEDTLIGGDDDDVLRGGDADDSLLGGNGNDSLDGGTGADIMVGGLGNDKYTVDDAGDAVIEAVNGGTDTVNSSISYALGSNVENLTLTGDAAIDGTGNALDNVITGNAQANVLSGGAGADRLNGGAGADTMIGGAGDDTYVIDDAGDTVVEAFNEGTDSVQSSISTTLAANVEKLTLTGDAAIDGTGNGLDNAITGNAQVNVLDGGAGLDVLKGNAGADVLLGGEGNDNLNGGDDNDLLIGGIGDDFLTGGNGVDVFALPSGFGADRVTDFSASDFVDLRGHGYASGQAVVNSFIQVGNNVILGLPSGDQLTLQGVQKSSLSASQFIVSEADVAAVPADVQEHMNQYLV
jgi:2',3'-cyclic-nucleotide 2'-phosphodiesterase (5'-nucleotidase family)/Ca2+-binding RTX toxin-like protein